MPNIIEYNATGEITPSDKGIQAAEVAGRRLGQFGNEIGASLKGIGDKIEQHMAVMETSELYKTGAQLEFGLQKQFEQQSADLNADGTPNPNSHNRDNPHFGDQFMVTAGQQIDGWASHVGTDRGKEVAATLKAQIRNNIFRRVASGQAAMDVAHYDENKETYLNTLSAQLIDDPSAQHYANVQASAEQFIQDGTAHITDVETRERIAASDIKDFRTQLTMARYRGVGLAIEKQVGQTGDETKSPAKIQADDEIAKRFGFEFLDPGQQQAVIKEVQDAPLRGQEQFKSRADTAKSQAIEQGKAAFSQLNTAAHSFILQGKPIPPELVKYAQDYAYKYGSTNPGEVSSLNDLIEHGNDRAQENKVEPYNQQVRDNIQGGMSLPSGDPRRPTLASITQAWSHGSITKEDLSNYTEILNKLDKPSEDPTFKPAWGNFERWQTQMVQSIGTKGGPGTAAARAQFLHDSTASFMAQGHGGAGWDKALDNITNAQNPHSFVHVTDWYNKAANHNAAWIQQHDQFRPGATTAPAYGSKAAPVYPPKQGAPVQPKKLDDKAVDAAFGVK